MADQNSDQNSEYQLTYTMTQEENDLRTYTEDSKTSKNSEQRASDLSTVPTVLDPQLVSVCACLLNSDSDLFKDTFDSSEKQIIDSSIRVETYLCERRIPELIRFILTKIICNKPKSMTKYIADLMDDCMLFRAGHGKAPVLFEERHLKAVIHSFDPCNRGWLSAGQVRRAFITLGLTPKSDLEVKTSTQEVLQMLRETQEWELFSLVNAGFETKDDFYTDFFSSS